MSRRAFATTVTLLATALWLSAAPAWAQDELELKITPIRHATFVLEFGDEVIIVDPVANADYSEFGEPSVILITDTHPDHWHMETVAMLMTVKTKVIGPRAVADEWGGIDTVLEHEKFATTGNITVEAVPMYNIERGPREGEVYHPKGRGNGYVVDIGFHRVYIAGDTECIPEMKELEGIDAAFIPMNLPYTMTPTEAAECVKTFMPKVVYPYHHRGSDLGVLTWRLEDTPEIEVVILDWYPSNR